MSKNKILSYALSVASVLLLSGGMVAYAQTVPSWFNGTSDQFQQMVSDRLAQLADVQHKAVCDVSTPGDASCTARVVIDQSGKAKTNTTPTGLGPKQLLTAYSLTGLSTKPGSIIGIVDAYDDPNIASDLKTYESYYGLPQLPTCGVAIGSATSSCFEKMNENGGTVAMPAENTSWDLEIALDVEIAHATCENCSVLLVEASSSSFSDLMKAVDTAVSSGAVVVNGSWGASEFNGETAYDTNFNKTGVAFTFAAGDDGYGTGYPAASQYVTSVGGTTLLINATSSSYISETAWGDTGSGCSSYETKPSWQTDTAKGDCTKRTMNDVSADADPATGVAVYDSVAYDNEVGWFQVGGTSLSSAFMSGVYALGGVPSEVQANKLPYLDVAALHDVTSGSNGRCSVKYLCTAGPGYDGPTGLGTPDTAAAF